MRSKYFFALTLLGLALQCQGADEQEKIMDLIKGIIDVLVPPSLFPTLTSFLVQSNLTFSTICSDIGKHINSTNDDTYTLLEEIYNNLTMFEKRYAFVSIDEIGLTFENRSMKVLKVCSIFRSQS